MNRTVAEPLRRVLNKARDEWGAQIAPIKWGRHLLEEPKERVRELRAEEEAALFAALRADYHPIIRFALLTGCRLSECVHLTWHDIDWGGRTIWVTGKGNKRASIPMPPAIRELLWALRGDHPTAVFTFEACRNRSDMRRGERMPISAGGLQREYLIAIRRAGIRDFRFHDLRHTAATRVLRAIGNLNIVRRMLRHENIKTTVKYAHSQHDDVLAAMQAAADASAMHEVPPFGPPTGISAKAKHHA